MVEMPENIKNLLRDLDSLYKKTELLEHKLEKIFEEYGVEPDDLRAVGTGEVQTEAFACITNGESDIENNIKEIEKVFLYYANKNR